jgi:hypothetical protein
VIGNGIGGRSTAMERFSRYQVFRSNPNFKDAPMEIVYFIGAFILLVALIYGRLNFRYRDRSKSKVADQIVRDRYEHIRR